MRESVKNAVVQRESSSGPSCGVQPLIAGSFYTGTKSLLMAGQCLRTIRITEPSSSAVSLSRTLTSRRVQCDNSTHAGVSGDMYRSDCFAMSTSIKKKPCCKNDIPAYFQTQLSVGDGRLSLSCFLLLWRSLYAPVVCSAVSRGYTEDEYFLLATRRSILFGATVNL